jgi:hypothetical protein
VAKTKRVAGTDEDETVTAIPDVVGLVIVAVEPQTIIIVLHVEQLEIAIRVSNA